MIPGGLEAAQGAGSSGSGPSGPSAEQAVTDANDSPIADQVHDWQDTARFNDWRAHEEVWREAADGGCLDIAAAREHALTAQAELAGDWPVLETTPTRSTHLTPGCAWTCGSSGKASSATTPSKPGRADRSRR